MLDCIVLLLLLLYKSILQCGSQYYKFDCDQTIAGLLSGSEGRLQSDS